MKSHNMLFGRLSTFAHHVAGTALGPGGLAVDATVGGGRDTLFLARIVGSRGRVHGFDLQPQALEQARSLLEEHGADAQVTLHRTGHERMGLVLPTLAGRVDAVMFNLGYLPGGDRSVTTGPDTTIPALDAALELLRPGGLLTVMLYSGHPGGLEECERVLAHLHRVDPALAQVVLVNMHNHADPQVRLAVVEKGATG